MTDEPAEDLDAGDFAEWRVTMQRAIRGVAVADVPCDGCTACCRASQFVHVDPDERDALAHIPAELLFPAPGLPPGHMVMGYDEHGACPMLVNGACSIYEHRPRACRTYDCRVFAAAGVDVTDDGKPGVAARVRRWRFTFATPRDAEERDAMRRAARYLEAHPGAGGTGSMSASQRALASLEISDAFPPDEPPSDATVREAIERARASR